MNRPLTASLLGASVASLALSLAQASPALGNGVTYDAHGIRHETLTVGPVHAQETVGGRPGTGTYFYTFSYINARDAIDAMLQTARLAPPGAAPPEPDVTNLVSDVKSGITGLQNLSNMILGPDGVGDSNLPAGFHGHNPDVWHDMGFYSDDWSARCRYAEQAMGGNYHGGDNMAAAQAYIQTSVNDGALPSWDANSMVNSHGGVDWYVWDWNHAGSEDQYLKSFNTGPFAPHLVGVFVPSPGQAPLAYFHESDEHAYSGPHMACTTIASSYFLSQAQRWLGAQSALSNLGAGDLAGKAFDFARDDTGILADFGDPLVLALNQSHTIDVTGRSSAVIRARKNMAFVSAGSVLFDLYGAGAQRMEWVRGGDGFLVDADLARTYIAQDKPFDGRVLLGDAEGMPGGFNKLATFDHQHAGKIVGPDLAHLAVWINRSGDGRYHRGELHSLSQLGITEIDYQAHTRYDKDHEPLEQAGFTQHGKRYVVREVWFAFEPKRLAARL